MGLFDGTPFEIESRCNYCGEVEKEGCCDPNEIKQREEQAKVDAARKPPSKQSARVQVENRKAKRKVTVIRGLTAQANDLPDLLTQLQSACGAGGVIREGDVIELQGDQKSAVTKCLESIGYRVR
ncbi:MAG: translation initiation factor [Planctomycetota bacterium]